MKLPFVLILLVMGSLVELLTATPKYSTPVDKLKPSQHHHTIKNHQPPPLPTGHIKNYVDFDLKSQSSRYGKDEQHHHYSYTPYEHYYQTYDYSPYFSKGHDHHMLPYILGGFGILMLPLLTLMLTLAVNIAPASNIPTAVTTATGKFMESFNSTQLIADFRDRLEAALSKYHKD